MAGPAPVKPTITRNTVLPKGERRSQFDAQPLLRPIDAVVTEVPDRGHKGRLAQDGVFECSRVTVAVMPQRRGARGPTRMNADMSDQRPITMKLVRLSYG
jgi:hypothetical protein